MEKTISEQAEERYGKWPTFAVERELKTLNQQEEIDSSQRLAYVETWKLLGHPPNLAFYPMLASTEEPEEPRYVTRQLLETELARRNA